MNIYKSSAQLKEKAREQLTGHFAQAIGILFLVKLAGIFANLFISSLVPAISIPTLIFQIGITFIASVFLGVFEIGFTLYFLNIACGRPYSAADLLYGFTNQFNKSLTLSLVLAAITFGCEALYQIPYYIGYFTNNSSLLSLSYLGMALGLVVYILIYLRVALVTFLILDFPAYTVRELLRLSAKLMKGHKRRLFYLDMSFFPLILLSALTCMIGMLWVLPYEKMTKTFFFLDLMNPEQKEGAAAK